MKGDVTKVEEQRHWATVAHQGGRQGNRRLTSDLLLVPLTGKSPSESGGEGSSSVADKYRKVNRANIISGL